MKKYRSAIARACHEDAEAMFEVGAIDSKTMHEFDVNCLVPARSINIFHNRSEYMSKHGVEARDGTEWIPNPA